MYVSRQLRLSRPTTSGTATVVMTITITSSSTAASSFCLSPSQEEPPRRGVRGHWGGRGSGRDSRGRCQRCLGRLGHDTGSRGGCNATTSACSVAAFSFVRTTGSFSLSCLSGSWGWGGPHSRGKGPHQFLLLRGNKGFIPKPANEEGGVPKEDVDAPIDSGCIGISPMAVHVLHEYRDQSF